jgi:hypothetical protein
VEVGDCRAANAVQGAMVLALAGTDGCGALYPKSQKQNREWLQNPTPIRPRMEMADFNTLLARIQRPELLEGPVPQLSEENSRNLERLNELRRQFAHCNPTGWGIELQYMLNIVPVAADVFEHLTTTQGRPNIHFTEDQKQRMRMALAIIHATLQPAPSQARSVLDNRFDGRLPPRRSVPSESSPPNIQRLPSRPDLRNHGGMSAPETLTLRAVPPRAYRIIG